MHGAGLVLLLFVAIVATIAIYKQRAAVKASAEAKAVEASLESWTKREESKIASAVQTAAKDIRAKF